MLQKSLAIKPSFKQYRVLSETSEDSLPQVRKVPLPRVEYIEDDEPRQPKMMKTFVAAPKSFSCAPTPKQAVSQRPFMPRHN